MSDAFIRISYYHGKTVCPNCKEEAKEHNKKWTKDYLDAKLEKWSNIVIERKSNIVVESKSNLKR